MLWLSLLLFGIVELLAIVALFVGTLWLLTEKDYPARAFLLALLALLLVGTSGWAFFFHFAPNVR